jgi:glycosyltransferase involved in cell wall biosynthesis
MKPRVSFIVSAFNRPNALNLCVASLRLQTCKEFEVIIADNSRDGMISFAHKQTARNMTEAQQFCKHISTAEAAGRDCYESANLAANVAKGEYLCFPSDDGYYAPRFLELMLMHGSDSDLMYCNCIWDGRGYGKGEELIHLVVEPRRGKIDKGGFLVKREVFMKSGGFKGPFGPERCEDGFFIERLIRSGVTHRKVDITGWIHN